MIINLILGFVYVIIANITYKLLNKENKELVHNPMEFFGGMFWPIFIPYAFIKYIVSPFADRVIKVITKYVERGKFKSSD